MATRMLGVYGEEFVSLCRLDAHVVQHSGRTRLLRPDARSHHRYSMEG